MMAGEKRIRRLVAWHAANIMNASGNLKTKATTEKLLGEKMIDNPSKFRAEMGRRADARQARYAEDLEDILDG